MNSDQQKAAAEKLTYAVKNNMNGAYDEWTSRGAELKDHAAQADFVKRHAGLSETPTKDDLAAMHAHAHSSLQHNLSEIKSKSPGEHVVGGFCVAED